MPKSPSTASSRPSAAVKADELLKIRRHHQLWRALAESVLALKLWAALVGCLPVNQFYVDDTACPFLKSFKPPISSMKPQDPSVRQRLRSRHEAKLEIPCCGRLILKHGKEASFSLQEQFHAHPINIEQSARNGAQTPHKPRNVPFDASSAYKVLFCLLQGLVLVFIQIWRQLEGLNVYLKGCAS